MYEVKFYEEDHLYTINDIVVPSVSQIAAEVAEVDYSSIPRFILEEAARFGTSVHEGIEAFIRHEPWLPEDPREARCVFSYIKLMQKHKWKIESIEEIVHFDDIYAGRYDQVVRMEKGLYLLENKTNYALDRNYLSWQLTLYAEAWERKHGEKLAGLKTVWLQKNGDGELVDVKRIDKSRALEVIEYVKEKNKSPITF